MSAKIVGIFKQALSSNGLCSTVNFFLVFIMCLLRGSYKSNIIWYLKVIALALLGIYDLILSDGSFAFVG